MKSRVLVGTDDGEGKLVASMRAAGHLVRHAAGVRQAKALLDAERFDGIVVDMAMAGGAAIEIIRLVREAEAQVDTPILAIGGRTSAGELEGEAALVLDWLRKPMEVDRLVGSVEAARRRLDRPRPRILHVEDDPDVAGLVSEALGATAEVVVVASVAAARAALEVAQFDLAILDLGLADGNGIEVLPTLRREGAPPIPVVIFSAQDADPQVAGQVDAYLTKARTPIGSLVAIIENLTDEPGPMETAA